MSNDNTLPISHYFRFDTSTDCKDTSSRNHAHNILEVAILTHGKGNCLINDTIYETRSGDIIFIPPNHIHKTTYTSDSHSRFYMLLSEHYIPPYAYSLFSAEHYVYRNPKIFSHICSILNGIRAEYTNRDELSEMMITSYIHMFFTAMYRNQNFYAPERSGTTVFVEKILDYIKKNFASDITLSTTAERFSISSPYLSSIFKKETGMHFNEYVTTVRLNYAEQLLKQQGKKSISEIAYSCGFNDSNYFSRKFRQEYGTSPLQFTKIYDDGSA